MPVKERWKKCGVPDCWNVIRIDKILCAPCAEKEEAVAAVTEEIEDVLADYRLVGESRR